MDCPRTGKPMEEVEINGVKVDVSTGCGGVWFDNFEFEKFDEPHEDAGAQLIALMEKYRSNDIDLEKRLTSPRHPEVTMRRYFFSPKYKVEIDECPQCGGIWLDPGELSQIRSLFNTEEERDKFGQEFVSSMFNSPEIKELEAQNAEEMAKAKRFANMFKFICPSYYIPGKQDGAAF